MSTCTCIDCGTTINRRATSGLCRRCYSRAAKRRRRNGAPPCTSCGGPTSGQSTTGLCRPCNARTTWSKHLANGTTKTPRRPCHRCACPTRNTDRICADCRDVIAPEELTRWVA